MDRCGSSRTALRALAGLSEPIDLICVKFRIGGGKAIGDRGPSGAGDFDPLLLAAALDAAGYGILVTAADIVAPGPTILFANPAMETLTGYRADELVGRSPRLLQGAATDRAMLDRLSRALRAGQGFAGEALNYRKDGARYLVEWTIDPIRDRNGVIAAWVAVQRDVTARHRHRLEREAIAERMKVLVAELQHRTRNLIGVVRSIAGRTVRASCDLDDFSSRFDDRIDALARVQSLLSRLEDQDRVAFDELVRTELAAMHGVGGRVTLTGPRDIALRSATVQTLAMAVHELATNAIKYGALAHDDGRLAIDWTVASTDDGRAWLHVDWRESGVTMPAGEPIRGQGLDLIEAALPYQLGARTRFTRGADGIRCTIAIPLDGAGD